MALTFPMYMFWPSIFLGWLCKVTINRFGGHEATKAAMPLFLGLILGSVTMIIFWLVVDGFTGRTHHLLLPA